MLKPIPQLISVKTIFVFRKKNGNGCLHVLFGLEVVRKEEEEEEASKLNKRPSLNKRPPPPPLE